MDTNPRATMDIIGHADQPAKSAGNNDKIAQLCADNITKELISIGIAANRILTSFGIGSSECFMPGQQSTCRKVEIVMHWLMCTTIDLE
jgi:outer membrane protein OmpA-like peptidoglycan-associated protein